VEITVSARHTEVSSVLRAAVEEKIGRLSRFLEGMDRADVHFTQERNPRIADKEICEVTLEGHGHHVRCKVHAPDGFVAIDRAVSKLEQQLHKLKSKLKRRNHAAARVPAMTPTEAAPGAPLISDGAGPRIVKSKRFAMMPMTPEEAAQRMDLLGHGFFFFTNLDTRRSAVVYRRDDGDVGLIDEDG